ncbi:MAG TPA: ribosome maturation factor RimP [Microlunatus sp.]
MKDSQLSSLLTPILAHFSLELEEIDVIPAGKRRLLRVVVDGDGPEGRGPLLDDIAEATKAISAFLDTSDVVGSSAYTLEVSSRGINRPLTGERHWRRNRGRLVKADLSDGSSATGRIGTSDDEGVELDVDGTERRIAYGDVTKAIVQVEFSRPTADAAGDDDEDLVELDTASEEEV